MIATAITAIIIAMSVLISGCSGSIVPPAAGAGPTATDVDAAELPYDASPDTMQYFRMFPRFLVSRQN